MSPKDKILIIAIFIIIIVYVYYLQYLNINPYVSMLLIAGLLGLAASRAFSLP